MKIGRTSLGGYLAIALVLAFIGGFVYLFFFTQGETYVAHVTVINNASPSSLHESVYIGRNIYDTNDRDKQINGNYYLRPGQTRLFEVKTKFSGNMTPYFNFDVVDGHYLVTSYNYYPTKPESNVTLEWDGKALKQVRSS